MRTNVFSHPDSLWCLPEVLSDWKTLNARFPRALRARGSLFRRKELSRNAPVRETLLRWIAVLWVFALLLPVAEASGGEVLSLPRDQRPEWLRQDGIVMAGSWEPLLFRVRRDGSDGYEPTPEQREAYNREHSPEMVAELKALGVNFVMMHCYKGFGLESEKESMADAVRFSKLCHDAGLRVGVYNYSGAFGWELLFKEVPEAQEWLVHNTEGKPIQYGRATYRYYWNRNHPGAVKFYRNLVRFAVEEIETDLLHFDNYVVGPGSDSYSVSQFRKYLRENFTAERLATEGFGDVDSVRPPNKEQINGFLGYAWKDFACEYLADSYYDMTRYARALRPDVLLECNPRPVGSRIQPPVDHGRQLVGGEAFWDEAGKVPSCHDGKLVTRIPTYKVARRMDNIAFAYSRTPLELAEAMAFNLDCVGCVTWFEYGKLKEMPGKERPVAKELADYIRFFNTRRELFRETEVVADVSVLRSFPSQAYGDRETVDMTSEVEQALIANRIPFQIIYDRHLEELERYRCLVLAGCEALSDSQVEAIRRFTDAGGKLCVVGTAAAYDEWMRPRPKPPLAKIGSERRIAVQDAAGCVEALQNSLGETLSVSVSGPRGLCSELTQTKETRLVHLVNYRDDGPVRDVSVRVSVPKGRQVGEVRIAQPLAETDQTVPFENKDGKVTFTVPGVNVYAVAQVRMR